MPRDYDDVSCFQQISKKSWNLPLKFGYFHFSLSSSTSLTISWLAIFVSPKSSQTISLIGRSEPRFESCTGGKIRITFKKSNKNFDIFCQFLSKPDSKLPRPDQENERQDV